MKKILSTLLAICCFVSVLTFSVHSAEAASNVLPTASDNLSVRLKSTSELVATSNGYMRVFYNGQKIGIEYYDNSFNIISKKSIAMELPVWGGFYAGSNAYYVVEGQNNKAENDSAEVIRVIKYDTNWNKKGAAKITGNPDLFGGEVRYPFDYGCVEMTEYNGTLYIVTGHEGYVDPAYNQGHQGFLMIAVNEASMTGKIVDCDLWHSFAQYIDNKASDLYVLEQSEGSRFTKLTKYNAQNLNMTSFPILKYGGEHTSAWAISCYASVDGMALSSNNVLCLGTSIDQSKYNSVTPDTAHNIYLTVTPMSNFSEKATTVKWLTNYKDNGKSFLGAKITKINDNRFLVSWEEYGASKTAIVNDTLSGSILHYVFIDGKGNKIGKEFTASAPISDCQPIVKGSKVVYYASNANMVNFYTIDSQTGAFSKKAYRVAGENAAWELNNNVLTISGNGAITIDAEAKHRGPISTTSNMISYSSSDNVWAPIRGNVKNIVIKKGITSIPENEFAYFSSLAEVKLESGVKSIGKEAFYSCGSLSKITIPASVTSIGEDILWTGYYWSGDESHVVHATIYGNINSTAEKYAKANNINFVSIDKLNTPTLKAAVNANGSFKLSWSKISGAEKYELYIKQSDGKYKLMKTTTGTSFTTSVGAYGKQYTYKMRAVKGSIKSAYSAAVSVMNRKKLKTPTLKATVNSNGSFKLSWNKVSDAEKYELYIKQSDGKYKLMKTTTATSYTTSVGAYGKQYTYKMRAVKGSSKSAYSAAVNAKNTKKLQTPSLKVTVNKTGSFTLSWNKIAGATSYQLYIKQANGSYKLMKKTTATSFTTAVGAYGKQYSYKMRAVTSKNSSASSKYSAVVNAKNTKKLQAPTLKISVNKNGTFRLTWNKVAGATSYRLYIKQANGTYKLMKTTTSSSFTTAVGARGKTYSYKMTAVTSKNSKATSAYSNTISVKRL